MLECASKLEDKSLHVRLNDPSDAVANVQFHLKCWIYLQRKTNKDDNSNVQEINNVAQVTSDIEILNLVEAKLSEYGGPQLSQQQQITFGNQDCDRTRTGNQDCNRTKGTSFIAVEPHFGCNPHRRHTRVFASSSL